ncbi:MAG: flagellar hook-associated protein FlgL [Gammaproteobacteria bacterium]|nr:flagellar hook-associated protein FlgL [Gammaproteobacteria bacterium]
MRVASNVYQMQWLASIQRKQAELAAIQQQTSSGKRVSTAADDPAGAAQALLLQQGLDRLTNFKSNADTASRRLSLEEVALSQGSDTLNRVRELAIQAANATQTRESRSAMVAEVRELLTGLFDTANAQDGQGNYLFAGNQVQSRPFVPGTPVQYNGDSGVRSQRIGDTRTVQEGDPGSTVFMQVPAGNGTFTVTDNFSNQGTAYWTSATVSNASAWIPDTYSVTFTAVDTWEARNSSGSLVGSGSYSPGQSVGFAGVSISLEGTPVAGDQFVVQQSGFQSVFKTVQDFLTTLDIDTSSPEGRARFQNQLNNGLLNLDQSLQHLGNIRSQVGARLATIDRQQSSNADMSLDLAQSISVIRDLDYASAISKMEQQLNSLEAAQKAYTRTRSLSLFDVL